MLVVWVPSATASPILSISPGALAPTIGSPFALAVDIGGASDLYGFQFDIAFNPTILQATDIVEGSFLLAGGSTFYIPGVIDNTLGLISFTANTLIGAVPGVSGSGTLATIDFMATGAGPSQISIANVLLGDSVGNLLDFTTTVGAVAPVPEPASLTLFGMGLIGTLVGRHRRRRLKRQPSSSRRNL
jgi:general secretion pathway protein D